MLATVSSVVLPVTSSTLRLFIHVLAATIWVGGQLTLAALVPTLRALGADAPRIAARRFNRLAWPAFGVVVLTGIWNISEVDPIWDSDYGRTLMVKLAVVVVSGVTALVHIRAKSRRALAVSGALTGLSAIAVLFMAVML